MRIICTSDWHADWSTLGVRRHPEIARAVNVCVEHAIREKADAFLFLGDLADPDSGGDTFRAVALAQEAALRLRRAGIRSVWIAGNHDVCEDGTGASTLTALTGLEAGGEELVSVATSPRLVWLGPDVAVLCLPFTPLSHGVDAEKAAADLFPEKPARVVVAAHLMLPGIHPGSETVDMPRGREVLFPAAATTRAVLRLCGHYHARQEYDPGDGGPPVYIPGTLARLTFGEGENAPGFLDVVVPALPAS